MHRAIALIGLAALGLTGCTLGCGADIEYGVEILIMEPGGPWTEPISIRWRVDDGAWNEITDTEILGPGPDRYCSDRRRCLIGEEHDGVYDVEVSRGIVTARFETVVNANNCHVQTRTVPVELPSI